MSDIRLSYSKKLLLFVLSVGLIPLILLSTILYIDKIETETDSLKNQLTSTSEIGSENISEWIYERKNNVFAIAQDSSIVSSTKQLSDPNIEKNEYFENRFNLEDNLGIYLENFLDFENFIISNVETGEVIFYTNLIPPNEELKNQKHFQQATNGDIGISEVLLSNIPIPNEFGIYEENVPTFFISAPIKGEAGIEGILTARVNLFKINSLGEQTRDYYTEDLYLVNSEGYFLSKPKLLGEAIKSELIEKRPELELQIIVPDSNQFTEIFQSSNRENTVNNLNGYTNYLGNYVIGSITPVKGTDWSYVVEIEKKEAFLGITFIQILIFSTISLVLLIIVGTSFHFASNLTAPIRNLKTATEQIIQGDLNIKTAIHSKDEIGELSRSFEYMIENLKEMTDIESQLSIQQNLRKALDASSIVSMIDKHGKITYANDKFCEVSKYSKEELIGKRQDILRSKIHPSIFYADLWSTISNGNIWHGEICNTAKDGSLFWNDTTVIPFFDKDGKISEYVSIRINITEQKNLTKKLIKSGKLSAIGELSAKISHDIRNPLAVLNNEFEILKYKKILDENTTNRINNSIKRISHQIDNVLDYVKETPLQISKFNLTDITHQSLETLVVPSEVKINISENDVFIIADKHKMETVLVNLIFNAIQSVEGDGGTIDITLSETDAETIIEVKDSGAGITVHPINSIFDPLVTSKQKGTGLGLASVKNIVTQHEGSISVKNDPTIFIVKIPKK